MHFQPTKTDPSLYFSVRDEKHVGIHGSYIDDLLCAGDDKFKWWCQLPHEHFETSGGEEIPIIFAGFYKAFINGTLSMGQAFYVKHLEELYTSSMFAVFRSTPMKLGWLANTRPDLLFEMSQLAQIALEKYNDNARACWKSLKTAIRYAHVNLRILKFIELDRQSVRIVGYSDAAFANNHDIKS